MSKVASSDRRQKASNGPVGERLIHELKSRSAAVRALAVERLGGLGTDEAFGLVADRRTDRSSEVRMRAVEALARFPEAKVEHFHEALSDSDELVRVQAAESIGVRRDRTALRFLRKALRDRSPLVRSYAAAALGAIGGEAERAALARRLRGEESDVAKLGLLEGLWLLKDRTNYQGALSLLDSSDYRVRCATARALATTFSSSSTRSRMQAALRSRVKFEQSRAVRAAIEDALVQIAEAERARPLRLAGRSR